MSIHLAKVCIVAHGIGLESLQHSPTSKTYIPYSNSQNSVLFFQDESKNVLPQAKPLLTPEVEGRVIHMQHNFFDPQPIHDASAFFIRQCVHSWPDQDCIKIFRAFIPALENCGPGTPLLINDTVLPKLGQKTRYEECLLRQLDIAMLVFVNAKQRSESEFRSLLKEADERFEVSNPQLWIPAYCF